MLFYPPGPENSKENSTALREQLVNAYKCTYVYADEYLRKLRHICPNSPQRPYRNKQGEYTHNTNTGLRTGDMEQQGHRVKGLQFANEVFDKLDTS